MTGFYKMVTLAFNKLTYAIVCFLSFIVKSNPQTTLSVVTFTIITVMHLLYIIIYYILFIITMLFVNEN